MDGQAAIPTWLVSVVVGVILTFVLGLITILASMAHRQLMQRLDSMDRRFDHIEKNTSQINRDLDNHGQRIAHLEGAEGHGREAIPGD